MCQVRYLYYRFQVCLNIVYCIGKLYIWNTKAYAHVKCMAVHGTWTNKFAMSSFRKLRICVNGAFQLVFLQTKNSKWISKLDWNCTLLSNCNFPFVLYVCLFTEMNGAIIIIVVCMESHRVLKSLFICLYEI